MPPDEIVTEVVPDQAGNGQSVETTPTGTPTDVVPDQAPASVQSDTSLYLVDMPDGRKVTPEAAVEEYKRLQADYTKKSQKLAEFEKPKPEAKPWEQPDYAPQTWQEVMDAATTEAINRIRAEDSSRSEAEKATQAALDSEINAIKAKDPNLNSDAVFDFANKRTEQLGVKYPSFSAAYQDYKFFEKQEKLTEKRVVEANKQRLADPINAGAAPGGTAPTEYEPGMTLHEKAQMALKRFKT